jgi:hypothetical protein
MIALVGKTLKASNVSKNPLQDQKNARDSGAFE